MELKPKFPPLPQSLQTVALIMAIVGGAMVHRRGVWLIILALALFAGAELLRKRA